MIGYGIIQASAPKLLRRGQDPQQATAASRLWGLALAVVPFLIVWGLTAGIASAGTILIGGLFLFGGLFAINSALHSYLIVAYSDHARGAAVRRSRRISRPDSHRGSAPARARRQKRPRRREFPSGGIKRVSTE